MLTRFTRRQLMVMSALTVAAFIVLGWFMQAPQRLGIGQYTLHAQLPASGGLYTTANVTYRGVTIGRVTAVTANDSGVAVTMSLDRHTPIPADASANVHSVSAIGEQYLDLVSDRTSGQYLADGATITAGTVPVSIGPLLDVVNHGLEAIPSDKIPVLLREGAKAVGGMGPALRRLVDATSTLTGRLKDNLTSVNDIIDNTGPILDSQLNSKDSIARWAANARSLAGQAAQQDSSVRSILRQAAPTAEAARQVLAGLGDSLPQAAANLEVVLDMLKRYHKNVEQVLVYLPEQAAIAQTVNAVQPGMGLLDLGLTINQPPPCLTGFLPASQWRSPADTSTGPLPPEGMYCKIPKDAQNVVRGARNYPCADVPGKRAATPEECRSNTPYEPAGTNPWYGDPNQIVTCPAPAARCDQPVKPGLVIPAPSIVNGMNPLPADLLPQTAAHSDALTPPGVGSVTCIGQQPNPCTYTPAPGPAAIYNPSSGVVAGPDGTRYQVTNSVSDDDGWKSMLSPATGQLPQPPRPESH